MIKKTFIVYNNDIPISEELRSLIEYIETNYKVEIELVDYRTKLENTNEFTLTLLYLDDIKVKTFLKNYLNSSMKIAFIPHEESLRVLGSYGVSKDGFVAIDEAMKEENLSAVDVLTCNGEIVFTNVVIGDVHGLNYKNFEEETLYAKIKSFYLNLKNLGFRDYTLTTGKGQTVETAATGVMVLEHNSKFGKYNIINEELSLHDGRLNAFIISPTSIFSYMYYLLVVTFYAKLNPSSLPKTLGFIKTSKLDISSTKPMDFMLDGLLMSAKEINLEVSKDALLLSISQSAIQNAQTNPKLEDDKEIIKTQYLPKGEVKTLLLSESVPLFKKANEDDFKELFLALKENAQPSAIFIVLMVLSTLLATTGLFQSFLHLLS